MIIVYTPKGGERQEFEIEPDGFRLSEIKELETLSGKSFPDFIQGIGTKSVGDLRPLTFVFVKRANPLARYRDFDPLIGELGIESSRAELEDVRAKVEGDENLSAPVRESVLATLDDQIADAPVGSGKGPARSRTSTRGTGRTRRSSKSTS